MNFDQLVGRLSERYAISPVAVEVLAEAVEGGRGMAQFEHPALGGRGQWMPGMTQIGEMSN